MMTQNFSAPKLNAESAPSAGCLWFFLILVMFICCFVAVSVRSDYLKSIRLQNEGIRVNAKIIDKYIDDSCNDDNDCMVVNMIIYRFTTTNGKQVEEKKSIDSDTYSKTHIGDNWAIIYARTNPTIQQSVKAFRTPAQIVHDLPAIMFFFRPFSFFC